MLLKMSYQEKKTGINPAFRYAFEPLNHTVFSANSGLIFKSNNEGGALTTEIEISEVCRWITDGVENHYRKSGAHLGRMLPVFLTLLGSIMNEGIKNAAEHGNEWDANRKTTVSWQLGDDVMTFHIMDEGVKEIDLTPRTRITDPELVEELFSGAGGGIAMIRKHTKLLHGSAAWTAVKNNAGKIGTLFTLGIPTGLFKDTPQDPEI